VTQRDMKTFTPATPKNQDQAIISYRIIYRQRKLFITKCLPRRDAMWPWWTLYP